MKYLSDEFKEDFLSKSKDIYNDYYKTFRAIFVHKTNIPEFNSRTYNEKPINFLSESKCKAIGLTVVNTELPVAWYQGHNGFYPLYFREFEETDEILDKINKRY